MKGIRGAGLVCATALALITFTPSAIGRPADVPRVHRGALGQPRTNPASPAAGFAAGFSIETPGRVKRAAAAGVNVDILYAGPPEPRSRLAKALANAHMTVIDGRISGQLRRYECHRTLTVAPPPPDEGSYCTHEGKPAAESAAQVMEMARRWIDEDEADPLVVGYWVLDDWAQWDGGSARQLLEEIHSEIEAATPGYPTICGFSGDVARPGQSEFEVASEAENFTSTGCSMVGLYNYAFPLLSQRSKGDDLDWTMQRPLGEEIEQLTLNGWHQSDTPLLGIGQAWSGPFEKPGMYMAGLSEEQILAQAESYCSAGASAIGWYGWTDSAFIHGTKTPYNSKSISRGIERSIDACGL